MARKNIQNIIASALLGTSLLGMSGCASTQSYVSAQERGAIVDSESAFKYMQNPKIRKQDSKMVFVGPAITYGNNDVFVMNNDGTDLKNLTKTPDLDENYAIWVDEGKIAYVTVGREGGKSYTIDMEGISKQEINGQLFDVLYKEANSN